MSSTSNIPVMVLSFSEAERRNDFGLERQAATNIMQVVRDIDSKLVLDNLTKADGNCMIIAIVQQCQRPDILPHLPAHIQSLVQGTITPTMTSQFRVAVRQFVTENETGPVIQQISPFLTGSWDEYWSRMIQNRVWGDGVFLMCTAKLLEINILVVRHSSTKVLPYHLIRGRDVNPAGDSVDPSLYLGYTGSVFGQENHYQSLLPAADQDIFPPVFQIGSSPTQKQNKQQQRIESDRERQKKVRARTNARKLDPKVSDPKEDKAALKREKERMRKAAQRERKKAENLELYKAKHKESVANYRAAKKAEDLDVYKAKDNKFQAKCRAAQREKDEIGMKIKQNLQKHKSDKAQRKKDYKKTKIDQNNKQTKSRAKRKAQHGTDRPDPGVRAAKKKKVEDASERLKKFRLATMTGPDYICVSCHIKCFRHSVVKLTEDLESKIDSNFEDPDDWISDRNLVSNINIEWVNLSVPQEYKNSNDYCGGGERFLCKTCLQYLKNKKRLPPCSVMNGLQLHETDQQLREQNLMLTNLEAAMVSPVIPFQIITPLPKSLWGNLHNTSILVPVEADTITDTLGKMPRTPSGSGLIPIKFKRKVSYENNHYKQRVDRGKLFRFVQKMKENKNPFYEDVGEEVTDADILVEEFKEKIKKTDRRGYKFVCESDEDTSDDEAEEETKQSEAERKLDELKEKEEIEEQENYRKNDVVRKFQLPYDETVGLLNNCPEITVAPGEGQTPINSLTEKNWESRAFPHLFNPDGTGSFDDERPYKIRLQDYYKQRLLNVESRFRKTPTYLFAVTSHLESRRISSNIAMVGRRGKKSVVDGETSYQLEDAFKVTANVPNGPDYMKKLKNEMLARLDNLGAFQFFFTLSCADLRWDAIFVSILMEHGYSVNFKCKSVNGVFEVEAEARTKQGNWKPIEQFIKEDVDESYHKLVRNNVLLATRYFDHRLKQFISHIVMATSNVMCVISYTVRIEMQGRGAPHGHGTLHCCLKRLERLIEVDGQLTNPTDNPLPLLLPGNKGPKLPKLIELTDSDLDEEYERPLEGLEEAFKKLKDDDPLTEDDIKPLVNFIDSFVTVSTHIGTVGEDVVKIANEVQKHHHTKTCRKHNTTCRFHFPRPPAPKTILRIPVKKEDRATYVEAEKLIQKVMDIVTDPKIVEEIMGKYDKDSEEAGTDHKEKRELRIKEVCKRARVDYDRYLAALGLSGSGYTYHLARDIDEIFINSYNPEWLRAWNGNMDLQVTLDFYAVITYITDYFTKGEPAVINAMMEAVKDNSCPVVTEKMKSAAAGYVRNRTVGESEAGIRALPNLFLSMSNVKCKFAGTSPPEERSYMYRLATEKQIQANVPCIKLAGKEGLYYQQPDNWSKYLRRPNSLETLCYAQFVKMYDSASSSSKKSDNQEGDDNIEEEDGNEVEVEELDEVADTLGDSYDEYNHIMTYENNGNKGPKLPKLIELTDPIPGEATKMRKRRRPAALRFHKVGQNKDPDRFMYHELMLYSPRREEIPTDSKTILKLYTDEHQGRRKVDIVKSQVMPYLESVEEARYVVDELQKELDLDLTETGVNLDPQAVQENEECAEEGENDHPDFYLDHLDPRQLEYLNIEKDSDGTRQPVPYSRIELPPDEDLYQSVKSLDKYQAEVINIVVKYCRDLVKQRKLGNPPPVAPLVMVHGGAGAGKSTVINVAANICQKILAQDGDDLDCPHVLKLAFTGTAASKIGGNTLHSTFNFSFAKKNDQYTRIDPKKLDTKRSQLKNLALVIIDEISMVKVDLLYALNARLQEITQKLHLPFGGVSVMFFGDMMQLKPVQGSWIFDKPNCEQFKPLHSVDPRWPMFKSIVLAVNHRQGEDKEYADLLNRIRVGIKTDDDMKLLLSRVRKENHKDLEDAALFIGCTRKFVSKYNEKYIKSLPGEMTTLRSINFAANKKGLIKPRVDDNGTIGGTAFKDEIQVKKGAKIILIHNIDTSDSLTNGQLGMVFDFIRTKEGAVDKLVVKFNDERVGEMSRNKNPTLSAKFPGCVILERFRLQYSLSSKSSGGSTATLVQFPIWLAHAITCHKIQGQSIHAPQKVVVDLESFFRAGGPLAYVMFSRVEKMNQLFILNSLNSDKIVCDQKGKEETERLQKKSWNENPGPWMIPDRKSLKIASLNCNRLQPHLQYMQNDDRLLKADVVHVQETWVKPNTTSDLNIENYHSYFVSVGNGKGIASYYRDTGATFEDHKTDTFQVSKLTVNNVASINVYRSAGDNRAELVSVLRRMIDDSDDQAILVSGDFNICTMDNPNNPVTRALKDMGFHLLVDVATHIRGGHIDHLYWRGDLAGVWRKPSLETSLIERYSPYYTDHDAWLVTLQQQDPSQ